MFERIKKFIGRKISTIKGDGVFKAFREIYDEHIFIRSSELFLRQSLSELLDHKVIKRARKSSNYDVEIVADHRQLRHLVRCFPDKKHVFEKNFSDGAVAVTVCDGHDILAYNWIAFDNYRDDFLCMHEFEVGKHEVYQFDLFVDPQSRGAIVSPKILSGLYEYCLREGKTRLLTVVASDNHPSLNLHKKLAFREDKTFLRVYKLALWRWSKLMPHDDSYRSPFALG